MFLPSPPYALFLPQAREILTKCRSEHKPTLLNIVLGSPNSLRVEVTTVATEARHTITSQTYSPTLLLATLVPYTTLPTWLFPEHSRHAPTSGPGPYTLHPSVIRASAPPLTLLTPHHLTPHLFTKFSSLPTPPQSLPPPPHL